MDGLELLKKDWQNKEVSLPRLSYEEIYKMLWKKSSSVVKWIFIISIIEFAFWSVLSFLLKDSKNMQRLESYNADALITPLTVIGYIILVYFLYRFFVNYKRISATDNARLLMENILKTRRTVKQYVWFNIIYFIVASIVMSILQLTYDKEIAGMIENGNSLYLYVIFIGGTLILTGVVSVLIWLFYRLIYGFLLKRLKNNYNVLKQIDL